MSDTMHYYAVPGSSEFIISPTYLRPEGTVEMSDPNPNTDVYIASSDGTWIVSDYRAARKEMILKTWPVDKQLEALTESANGRHDKLLELQDFLTKVKETYPKPEE